MKKIVFLSIGVLIIMTSCQKSDSVDSLVSNTPVLLFKSGFEEGTYISEPSDGYQIIKGKDLGSDFSWPIRILGSDFSGIHRVQDDNGPAIDNYLEKTSGPDNEETTALFQRVNYDIGVTQSPYQINNIQKNPTELFITYWMKVDDTSLQGPDKWRALWEYKTRNYSTNTDGFRMIAFIITDLNGNPSWSFQGDRNPTDIIWKVNNTQIPVIKNEWFKVEYYVKWSKNSDGYASMRVNGELVGEHSGATTFNEDDLDFIMLTQVYGNTHPMHQWVDDIEIWSGLPSETEE